MKSTAALALSLSLAGGTLVAQDATVGALLSKDLATVLEPLPEPSADKVPTLRNVALTAPYLHDGSRATLDEAVPAMGRHQLGRDLDGEQVRLVVAFLGALTGKLPEFAPMPDEVTLTLRQQEVARGMTSLDVSPR